MIIPRFNPKFLDHVETDSPEDRFVNAVNTIGNVYRKRKIFQQYTADWFNDFVVQQDKPLYLINGKLTTNIAPPLTEAETSVLWMKRLQGYGKNGERVVTAISDLVLVTELLEGKRIEFMAPYRRALNPIEGFIAGGFFDFAPSPTEQTPTLFVEVSTEAHQSHGVHYPIMNLCNISIG